MNCTGAASAQGAGDLSGGHGEPREEGSCPGGPHAGNGCRGSSRTRANSAVGPSALLLSSFLYAWCKVARLSIILRNAAESALLTVGGGLCQHMADQMHDAGRLRRQARSWRQLWPVRRPPWPRSARPRGAWRLRLTQRRASRTGRLPLSTHKSRRLRKLTRPSRHASACTAVLRMQTTGPVVHTKFCPCH